MPPERARRVVAAHRVRAVIATFAGFTGGALDHAAGWERGEVVRAVLA